MNPSPDRGKECLPPKKRESRHGSGNQRPPLDEFKPPATPPRIRPASNSGSGDGGRESSEDTLTNPHNLLRPMSPPLPSPGIPLPWHLTYPSTVPFLFLPGQVGERDDPLPAPFPYHPRWLQGEIPLTLPPSSSSSSFKTPFTADSRDMWSYFNTGRRNYSSSLFSPSHLFSQPSLYPPDPSLTEGRNRYLGKRPNGLDGLGSRTASASRVALTSGEYGNEPSGSARLGGKPHSLHANRRRRHQEVPTGSSQPVAVFRDFQAPPPEGPDSHSSLQDMDPRGTPKAGTPTLIPTSPQPHGAETRAGREELLDPLGGSVAEAHIYYSLGSVYSTLQPSHLSRQAQAHRYPLCRPSGSSLHGLHTMRNSQHSTQGQPNSHSTERDRERNIQQEQDREREHEGDRDIRERDSKRDRDKDRRELSPGQQYSRPLVSPLLPHMTASPPDPHHISPALLPHFAKGSLIELVGGRLKRVEELRTEDFLRSADTSPEFHLSTCTVLLIAPSNTHGFNHLQVFLTDRNTQELLTVLVEYPFFVRDRGWSSCCPQRTSQLYGLSCRQLSKGDICLALTPLDTARTHTHSHTRTAPRGQGTHTRARASTHREDMPPPPPPPPLPHPSPALVTPPLPPPPADPPTQEQPRPRKRRWSAPDLLPPTGNTGIDKTTDLPHCSKQRKWQ